MQQTEVRAQRASKSSALAWSFGDEGTEALRLQHGCLGPLAEAAGGASTMEPSVAVCRNDPILGTSASARTLACKKDAQRRNVCEFAVKLAQERDAEDSSEPVDSVRRRIDAVLRQQAAAPTIAIEVSEPAAVVNEGRGDIYLLEGRFCGEVSAAAAMSAARLTG